MKKILLVLVTLALFASCKKNETPNPVGTFSAPDTVEGKVEGGETTFELKAPSAWTITNAPEWAPVSPESGTGNETIKVSFAAIGETDREQDITITLTDGSKKPLTVKLVQTLPKEKIDYEAVNMVKVDGGKFTMSSEYVEKDENGGINPFQRAHEVTLSSFYIGKYEVTQELWKKIMGNEPVKTGGSNPNPDTAFKDLSVEGGPVFYVTWMECIEFCNKLSEAEGMEPYYTITGGSASIKGGTGYRLPTEAEWEYAARGGSKSKGYELSGGDSANGDDLAWTNENCTSPQPVGLKKANELGLHDMSGNVWEQVWDWYGEYPETAVTNPQGPDTGTEGVMRGASWYGKSDNGYYPFRPDVRLNMDRLIGDDDRGFRIARSAE